MLRFFNLSWKLNIGIYNTESSIYVQQVKGTQSNYHWPQYSIRNTIKYISNKNDFNCGEDHEAYSNEESSECLLTLSSGTLLIHLTARMYSDPHWSAWKSLRFLSLYYYKVYNKYYLIIHMWTGGFYLFPLCCHGYIFKQLSLR